MASPTSPELSIKSTDSAPGQEEERVSRRPGTALSFRLGPRGSSQPADDRRRRSIQFHVGSPDRSALPRRNGSITSPGLVRPHTNEKKVVGRGPSPPPPSTYQRGVSFDTFDNRDATDYSFTLNYKHRGYQHTRRSRTFLVGADQNEYSDFALEWLMDELVDDGDEIVCLRVVEKDSKIASDVEEGKYRQEAEKLFKQVIQKNSQDEKAISLVLELAIGKVQEIIQRMIHIYEPAVLIVGTRGRSMNSMQGLLPGSVSKYCLQQSPIPVIVVRPSAKREKKKKKRLADPSRRGYENILQMSEKKGSGLFTLPNSTESSLLKTADAEAAAVAKAVGLPRGWAEHIHNDSRETLSSKGSDHDDKPIVQAELDVPRPASPNVVVMKSPMLGDLDTPSFTESESENESRGSDELVVNGAASDEIKALQNGASSPVVSFGELAGSEAAVSGEEKGERISTSSAKQPDIVIQQPEETSPSRIKEAEQTNEDTVLESAVSSGTVTPQVVEAASAGSTSAAAAAILQPPNTESAQKEGKGETKGV